MLEETLKSVKAAEEEAVKKVQEAEEKAGEILEQARQTAKQMKADTIAECKSLVTAQELDVSAEGDERKQTAKSRIDAEIEAMRQAALNREKNAIQAVLEHLV